MRKVQSALGKPSMLPMGGVALQRQALAQGLVSEAAPAAAPEAAPLTAPEAAPEVFLFSYPRYDRGTWRSPRLYHAPSPASAVEIMLLCQLPLLLQR